MRLKVARNVKNSHNLWLHNIFGRQSYMFKTTSNRFNARCNRCTYSMTKCHRPRKPPCAPGSRSTPPGPSGTSASAPGLCFTHWLVMCEREFNPCNPLTELTPNWMFQPHPILIQTVTFPTNVMRLRIQPLQLLYLPMLLGCLNFTEPDINIH